MSRNSAAPIRVLVLAPYPTVRAGLRAVVESDPTFAVAGEADGVDALLSKLEALAPDAMLLDPGASIDALFDALEPMSNGGLLPPLVLIAADVGHVREAAASGSRNPCMPLSTASRK